MAILLPPGRLVSMRDDLPAPLKPRFRAALAIVGGGLLSLLALATQLQPDPSGLGTHRQLGIPECTFVQLFGRPCPTCGMTTSWAHVMRGEWKQAMRANSAGMMLALAACIVGPWLLAVAGRGRWIGWKPTEVNVAVMAIIVIGVTLLDWLRRLMMNE